MTLRERATRNAKDVADDNRNERMSFDISRVRECEMSQLAIRFAFGFVISLVVSGITHVAGYRVGGLFLAFPAILPASLTLIAENDSERKARVNGAGAMLGGLGLVLFALVSWEALGRVPVLLSQVMAAVAWAVAAVGGYVILRHLARRSATSRRQPAAAMRSASSPSEPTRS